MSDDVKLRFEADDNLSQAVNKINGRLGEMDSTTKKNQKSTGSLTSVVKKATVAFGAYVSVTRAWSMAQRSIEAYDKQIKAEAELERALGYTSQALLDQATALQAVTRFGDEATIEAMGLVAAFVDEEKQIKQLMPLIQDLATAKSMDLNAAADLVTRTLASSTNAMSRYGIEVEGAQGSTERLESLTNSLENAFGGAAVTAGQTGAGQIEIYRSRLGDLQEDIGEKLLPAMTAFYKVTVNIAEFMADNMHIALAGVAGVVVSLSPAIWATVTAIKAKTVAILGLNAAMNVNPLFLTGLAVAAAITAVGTAMKKFAGDTGTAKESVIGLDEATKTALSNMRKLAQVRDDLREANVRSTKSEKFLEKKAVLDYWGDRMDIVREVLAKEAKEIKEHGRVSQGLALAAERARKDKIDIRKQVNKELEEIDKKYNQANIDRINALREDVKGIRESMALDALSTHERELQELKNVYDERRELFRELGTDETELTEWYESQKSEIVKQYSQDRIEEMRREHDRLGALQDQAIYKANEKRALELATIQEIERYQMSAKDRAIAELEDEIEVKKSILGEDAENLILLEEYKQQRIDEIKEQYAEKEEERTNNALQYAQFAYDQISSIMSAVSSNRMKELDAEYKKEKEVIDGSRMSRRAKEQATQKLEEETAKKRHELALKQWRQDLIMSIVNTALGVSRAIAQTPPPAGIPFIAMAGAAGAVSTGIIAANKPKFATGGFVPGQSTSGDRVGVQVNSGEAILNANQQREFMAIANGRRGTEQPGNQIGDTTINISGNATPDTVNQLENTMANHRQAMLEQLYEASSRGEIDTTRLQLA